MSLRFVDGRPVSAITTQFLEWICTKLQAVGKAGFLLIWDNASWHHSKDAPGIEWTAFPPELMGYCVRTVGKNLYATFLAVAAASALGAIDSRTLLALIGNLDHLLRILRETCQIQQITDLASEQIWQDFLSKTEHMPNRRAKW